MKRLELEITNSVGLHARPASLFVKHAKISQCSIRVRNATKESSWSDGKSIIGVLTMGVQQGHMIEITFDGPDEETAAQRIKHLIECDFAEADLKNELSKSD